MTREEVWTKIEAGDTDFGGVSFVGSQLNDMNMRGVNLAATRCIGTNFAGSNLRYANLTRANLTVANFNGTSLFKANLTGANLRGASFARTNLYGADLTGALLPSPLMVLQCHWGTCSDELTVELMRYDAANHPDPGAFDAWAADPNPGQCPYRNCVAARAVDFNEMSELWSPGPAKSALELMNMLLKEHCVY